MTQKKSKRNIIILTCIECKNKVLIPVTDAEKKNYETIKDEYVCDPCMYAEDYDIDSKIFTKKQIHTINLRILGEKYDPHGCWAKTKPKIKEILEYWLKRKEHLEKIL